VQFQGMIAIRKAQISSVPAAAAQPCKAVRWRWDRPTVPLCQKTDAAPARFEIISAEPSGALGLRAIHPGWLSSGHRPPANARVPTAAAPLGRSTWGLLRNPATKAPLLRQDATAPRQRVTRRYASQVARVRRDDATARPASGSSPIRAGLRDTFALAAERARTTSALRRGDHQT